MKSKLGFLASAVVAIPLAFAGCMKSGEDTAGSRPESAGVLDAGHGGARIVLPEIDPAALGKAGADTSRPDTTATAWFELVITGDNMQTLSYRYALGSKGSTAFEIKGIPAGKKRSFHGSLVNAKGVLTHEGVTLADIQAGAFTDVRLFLAKASGSAEVCVVIEGQKLPACAADTLPPPPPPATGGSIPMPGGGAKQTTLCFEMRFDYGTNACEIQGFAKMDFLNGTIPFGDIMVADRPGRFYSSVLGKYDSSAISFYGVTDASTAPRDTLSLQGFIGKDRTMAKGDYTRWPSGKKGNWTMSVAACGSWTPVYPDSSCFATGK